jgi:hypothetical protein
MAETKDLAADWDVIATLPEATLREAPRLLRRWGEGYTAPAISRLTLNAIWVRESDPAGDAQRD